MVMFSPYKTYSVREIDEYTWEVWGYNDAQPIGVFHDPDKAEKLRKQKETESRDDYMTNSWGKAKVVNLNPKERT